MNPRACLALILAGMLAGQKPVAPLKAGVTLVQEVVRCEHVRSASIVATLTSVFPADELRVIVGPESFSPKLEAASLSTTSSEIRAMKDAAEPGNLSKEVILIGTETAVAAARALIAKLDRHRDQVRLRLKITDISFDGLRQLGINYDFSKYSIREFAQAAPTSAIINSLKFAQFGHLPISIDATLSALEQRNQSKTLAEPTISLLDGERGFILIGDRILYPKLTGFTQAQTPIYDKEEVRVGIYVQVALQMGGHGDMILAVYPQVSTITGYLNVSGASYPQISTREQQTTVRLKENETLVIGGLITDQEIKNLRQIPLLAKVPGLGELFRNRTKTSGKKDLVIMITPEILRDGDLEAEIRPDRAEPGGHSHGETPRASAPGALPIARPTFPAAPPPAPLGLPAVPWPVANQYSAAKAELGWLLFFDKRLSADGTVSCGSCHQTDAAFTDRRERPTGVGQQPGRRNSPSIINAVFASALTWDGGKPTLEAQAREALTSPIEMGMDEARVVEMLRNSPDYRARFKKVFGGEPTLEQALQAIATFERLVISGGSAYDRYAAGEANALNAAQKRGLVAFDKYCRSCHPPPLFTNEAYVRLNVGRPGLDSGRLEVTGQEKDRNAFRVPGLRDVSHTGPYMHDGSLRTLEDVLHFYLTNRPDMRFQGSEMQDMLEFLQALDGEGWQRYRAPRLE